MAKQRLRRGLSVLALSLVAGVGISGAAWFAVHMTLVGRAEDLRSRALNYARTFAATVPTQAEHGQLPDLEPLAKYAAAVGLLYLQVVAGSEVLLERTSLKEAEPLLAAPMDLPLPQVKLRSVGGQPLVDVTVSYSALPPYFGAPSRGAYAAGRLRLGLDASSLNWAATNTRALAAALAGIAWGGLLICAARWKRLRREGARPCPPPTTDRAACAWGRTMAAGDITLYLDENRFVVAGLSARLTPKQVRLVSDFFPEIDFRRFQVNLETVIPMDDPAAMPQLIEYGRQLWDKMRRDETDPEMEIIAKGPARPKGD